LQTATRRQRSLSLLEQSAGNVLGPYGPAPTAQVRGDVEILSEMGSRYQLEHGQAPRYRFVAVGQNEAAQYRLTEHLHHGVRSVLSPYAGNRLRHAYATGGASWQLTKRQDKTALRERQPRTRYAMVGGASNCGESALVIFTLLCHQIDPSTIECVELMTSDSVDHAFAVVTLNDGKRTVHDHWSGPQACRWEHYRFSDRSDCKAALCWRPGEALPESLDAYIEQSLEDASAGYDLRTSEDPDLAPHERLLRLMAAQDEDEPSIESELRTETDCLLTPDQKARLGLGPDEVFVYQLPDGTLFSNDFVPRAQLDEIDRLQLQPERQQLIEQCKAAIIWKNLVFEACGEGNQQVIQDLLQDPARPTNFPVFCAEVANAIWDGFNEEGTDLPPLVDVTKTALLNAGMTRSRSEE
jgi:hypothetical protein